MKSITVSSPGKLFLMGEHAVVYGKPALVITVDKRCQVTLKPTSESVIRLSSTTVHTTETVTMDALTTYTRQVRRAYNRFLKDKNIAHLTKAMQDPLSLVKLSIIEAFAYYRKQISSGFELEVVSEIPVASGLGSSAAISTAVIAAVTTCLKVPYQDAVINEIAYTVEQYQHGTPSGVDPAVITFGSMIWFRKESAVFKVISTVPFELPEAMKKKFILIDTGKPVESTGEMVSRVRNVYKRKPTIVQTFLAEQEAIARALLAVVKAGDENEFINLIKQGERNLETIGVVSSQVCAFIRSIEKAGGAAKICGGGGYQGGTGIVLAYHSQGSRLQQVLKQYPYPFFQAKLGVEGVRVVS